MKRSTVISYYAGYNYLSELCDIYGSDKGSLKNEGHCYYWMPHTYTDYYHSLFGHCRNHISNVFECGIGTNNTEIPSNMGKDGRPGASLRVWRDYFPNARIFGADIDKEILFEEDRIITFHMDQTDEESIKQGFSHYNVLFDLMIDDGLHSFESATCLFKNTVDKLSDTGIYIIEDVLEEDFTRYEEYFFDYAYNVEIISLHRGKYKLGDNSLIVIRKHNEKTSNSKVG